MNGQNIVLILVLIIFSRRDLDGDTKQSTTNTANWSEDWRGFRATFRHFVDEKNWWAVILTVKNAGWCNNINRELGNLSAQHQTYVFIGEYPFYTDQCFCVAEKFCPDAATCLHFDEPVAGGFIRWGDVAKFTPTAKKTPVIRSMNSVIQWSVLKDAWSRRPDGIFFFFQFQNVDELPAAWFSPGFWLSFSTRHLSGNPPIMRGSIFCRIIYGIVQYRPLGTVMTSNFTNFIQSATG